MHGLFVFLDSSPTDQSDALLVGYDLSFRVFRGGVCVIQHVTDSFFNAMFAVDVSRNSNTTNFVRESEVRPDVVVTGSQMRWRLKMWYISVDRCNRKMLRPSPMAK